MSKMLQVFTLSYPDSNQVGPKFLVLFNNYSRFETDNEDNELSYDDESDEDEAGPKEKKQGSIDREAEFKTYIYDFKEDLVN